MEHGELDPENAVERIAPNSEAVRFQGVDSHRDDPEMEDKPSTGNQAIALWQWPEGAFMGWY